MRAQPGAEPEAEVVLIQFVFYPVIGGALSKKVHPVQARSPGDIVRDTLQVKLHLPRGSEIAGADLLRIRVVGAHIVQGELLGNVGMRINCREQH